MLDAGLEAIPPTTASYVMLVVLFAVLPVLSARTHRSGVVLTVPRRAVYLSAVTTQWLVVGALLVALWLEGRGARSVGLGRHLPATATAGWTLGVLAVAGLLMGAVWLRQRRTGERESAAVRHLIPRTAHERWMFALLVSPTAGIAEEVLYRGFALPRIGALLGGDARAAWTAAVLTAVAFALGHVYQGAIGATRAGVLGLALAVPYVVTGSLVPSILAHTLIDVVSGAVLGRDLLGHEPERAAAA